MSVGRLLIFAGRNPGRQENCPRRQQGMLLNGLDLAWVLQRARGEKRADLQNTDVFEILAELALAKAQAH